MFCNGCGKQIPDGSAFCPACGKSFGENQGSNNQGLNAPYDATPNPYAPKRSDNLPLNKSFKYCKGCNSKIDVYTTVCPNCGKKQKKGSVGKTIGIVVGVFFLLGVIGSMGGGDTTSNPPVSDGGTAVVETQPETAPVSPDTPTTSVKEEVPVKSTYGVGETAVAKSYKLTVESISVVESDNQFMQADEGYEFVGITLLLENTSNSELQVSSILDFDAYVDGFSVDEDLIGQSASDVSTMNGTVSGGKKLRGQLTYQLPIGWSELEIDVDLGYSSKDKVKLLLTK